MENNHSFKLVEGEFTPAEAGKVLYALISSKINYHNLQAFSFKERYNGDNSQYVKRVEALKSINEDLQEVLVFATENRLQLKIEGNIEITFI
jgi:predicted NACHT family NTPase